MLPYFLDECQAGKSCLMNQYMEYCFDQQDTVLGMTDMSHDDFILYWSDAVAVQFSLDYLELLDLYYN